MNMHDSEHCPTERALQSLYRDMMHEALEVQELTKLVNTEIRNAVMARLSHLKDFDDASNSASIVILEKALKVIDARLEKKNV